MPDEQANVSFQIKSVPKGTKVSLSKLKLAVNSQTEATAEVIANYHLKVKRGVTQQSDQQHNFTLTKRAAHIASKEL